MFFANSIIRFFENSKYGKYGEHGQNQKEHNTVRCSKC